MLGVASLVGWTLCCQALASLFTGRRIAVRFSQMSWMCWSVGMFGVDAMSILCGTECFREKHPGSFAVISGPESAIIRRVELFPPYWHARWDAPTEPGCLARRGKSMTALGCTGRRTSKQVELTHKLIPSRRSLAFNWHLTEETHSHMSNNSRTSESGSGYASAGYCTFSDGPPREDSRPGRWTAAVLVATTKGLRLCR